MNAFDVILVLAIVGSVCQGCSISRDWRSETIEERARKPKWVVYGTVISNHLPVSDTDLNIDQEYVVIVKPLCWLKESEREQQETMDIGDKEFKNITVLESAPCVFNNLTRGKKYILFLGEAANEGGAGFSTDDVNLQPGAFEEPTIDTIKAVNRGIDRGSKGSPQGRCQEGVEIACFLELPVPNHCNLGATIKVTLWAFFIGIALAIELGMAGY